MPGMRRETAKMCLKEKLCEIVIGATERKPVRIDRIRRLVYAGMSAAALVIAWRVAGLLIENPADAAIILGCVAVWALARMDVILGEQGRM